MRLLQPRGWKAPVGYANGIEASGRVVFVAGQVGWDAEQAFHSEDLAPQFEQALRNVLAILAKPTDLCRITAYCCDKPAYLAARAELGRVWRRLMGRHYPAMTLVFVSELLDSPGKIELEATAVIPEKAS